MFFFPYCIKVFFQAKLSNKCSTVLLKQNVDGPTRDTNKVFISTDHIFYLVH